MGNLEGQKMEEQEILPPEIQKMKDNIITRAKLLSSENADLRRAVLSSKWNEGRRQEILEELRKCQSEIENSKEAFERQIH